MYAPGLEHGLVSAWRRWVLRGRRERGRMLPGEPGWQLATTARYRASMVAVFALFTTIYTFAFFISPEIFADQPTWKRLLLEIGSAAIWALVTYLALAACVERVRLNDQGLTHLSLRGRRFVPWPDLAAVKLGADADTIRLVARDGRTLSVSLFLDGYVTLLESLERCCSVDDAVKARLLDQRAPTSGAAGM